MEGGYYKSTKQMEASFRRGEAKKIKLTKEINIKSQNHGSYGLFQNVPQWNLYYTKPHLWQLFPPSSLLFYTTKFRQNGNLLFLRSKLLLAFPWCASILNSRISMQEPWCFFFWLVIEPPPKKKLLFLVSSYPKLQIFLNIRPAFFNKRSFL